MTTKIVEYIQFVFIFYAKHLSVFNFKSFVVDLTFSPPSIIFKIMFINIPIRVDCFVETSAVTVEERSEKTSTYLFFIGK